MGDASCGCESYTRITSSPTAGTFGQEDLFKQTRDEMGYMNTPCFAKTMTLPGGGQPEGGGIGGGDGSMAFAGGAGSWSPPEIMPPRPPDGDSAVSMRTQDNCGKEHCCCCVVDLKLKSLKKVTENPSKTKKGIGWEISIEIVTKHWGRGTQCKCTIEWLEKLSHLPAHYGRLANQRYDDIAHFRHLRVGLAQLNRLADKFHDIFKLLDSLPAFAPLRELRDNQPCPGKSSIKRTPFKDTPFVPASFRKKVTLVIKPRITSCKSMACFQDKEWNEEPPCLLSAELEIPIVIDNSTTPADSPWPKTWNRKTWWVGFKYV